MDDAKYNMSFRCFFKVPYQNYTSHYMPDFPVKDIPRWIDAYLFTHPNCASISCKVWFVDDFAEEEDQASDGYAGD